MNPDGTGAANISFSFPRDSTMGAVSLNTSAAPFPSIGTEGCAVNTPACGPNNENARGLFFSGTIFGVEFLGIGGAHATGKLQYLYLSDDTDATIDFRFLDIWAGSGGSTKGVSAAHTLGDRLYFGMQDTGGNKPYFFALVSTVQAPGLNAVVGLQPTAGTHVLDLQGDELPDLGQKMGNSAPVVLIDSITDFNARIYVANNGGMVRATTNLPLSPAFAPGHWVKASPTRVEFTAKASVTTPKTASLLPSDRAFPAMVSFKGRLYAARNTTTGPQLWGCDPQGDLACDPADWILIAANGQGDTQLTQLNDAANTTIGLLAATANTLFIGFNNASGVQIFKTTAATPTLRSDFTGQLGCVAGVAGCNGLGGKGLGAPATNTRILDAKAMTFNAQSWLYVVAGNATAPVQVFRVSP